MGLAGCSLETEKAPEEQTSVSVAGENKDMETKPESDTQADTGRKVGISYAEVSAGFNVSQAEAFEKIGKDYGYQVTLLNADNNVEKQVADVEDLIAQGMDVIFFNPVDSSACSTVMDKVKAAGIDMGLYLMRKRTGMSRERTICSLESVNVMIREPRWHAGSVRTIKKKVPCGFFI